MANEKIEPRLQEELRRIEAAGQADREISVVIEVRSGPEGAPGESRRVEMDYAELERRARLQQQGICERLSEIGVTADIHPMPLSNSVEVRLTPAQIRQMGGHKDVKLIVLNREEQVTA